MPFFIRPVFIIAEISYRVNVKYSIIHESTKKSHNIFLIPLSKYSEKCTNTFEEVFHWVLINKELRFIS